MYLYVQFVYKLCVFVSNLLFNLTHFKLIHIIMGTLSLFYYLNGISVYYTLQFIPPLLIIFVYNFSLLKMMLQ